MFPIIIESYRDIFFYCP